MTTPISPTNFPSTALLGLKRFIRGTLRQLGIGLTALMIVLNLGVHTPELTVQPHSDHAAARTENSAQDDQLERDQGPSARKRTHTLLVGARMTHHHLTSARLSIPNTPEQTIVNVSRRSAYDIGSR